MAKPRPGKYDHVVGTLPRLQQEVDKQTRVEEMKRTCQRCGMVDPPADNVCYQHEGFIPKPHLIFAGLGPTQLAEEYVKLRREKDEHEAAEKLLNLRIEAATQLLTASQDRGDEAWGKYGVKDNALRLENGDTIRVESQPYGQVVDKEAFRLWCIANGYERQLQLWPTTMNSLVKERAAAGEPYPDGCEAFRKDTVKYVAAGGKDE